MTIESTPLHLTNLGASAEQFRRMQYHVWGQAAGPWLSTDLLCSVGTGMTVDIAGGAGVVQGTTETYQGAYFFENRGSDTVSLSAADPTNPRWDLIVVTVNDADVTGVLNSVVFAAVTGTPSGSPSDPATPANSIVLGRAVVPASASTPSQVDDLRSTSTGQSVVSKAAYGGVVGEATYNTNPALRATTYTTLSGVSMTVDVRAGHGYEVHLNTGDWNGLNGGEDIFFQCDVGSTQLIHVTDIGTADASWYGAGYLSGLTPGSTTFNIQAKILGGVELRKATGGAALEAWIVERPA